MVGIDYLGQIWDRTSTKACYLELSGEDIVRSERIPLSSTSGTVDSAARQISSKWELLRQLKDRRIGSQSLRYNAEWRN